MHFTKRRAEWRSECSINVTKTCPCKITSQFDIFFENLSRILNLNLSNGGERNSMKLGFKISAYNGVQLNIEIKREGERGFLGEQGWNFSSGE